MFFNKGCPILRAAFFPSLFPSHSTSPSLSLRFRFLFSFSSSTFSFSFSFSFSSSFFFLLFSFIFYFFLFPYLLPLTSHLSFLIPLSFLLDLSTITKMCTFACNSYQVSNNRPEAFKELNKSTVFLFILSISNLSIIHGIYHHH